VIAGRRLSDIGFEVDGPDEEFMKLTAHLGLGTGSWSDFRQSSGSSRSWPMAIRARA